jgi:type I site-specific restriction endonuclease
MRSYILVRSPSYAYLFDTVQKHRHLTNFLREGIKYKDLSDKEEKYEETFEDKTTGLFPEEIRASAMNKWLFNKDTVNKVLML